MYNVVVDLAILPDQVAAFIATTVENIRASRSEPGFVGFELVQTHDDPTRFFFYESWKDLAAFQSHQQTAHYLRWREAAQPMMARPRNSVKCTRIEID